MNNNNNDDDTVITNRSLSLKDSECQLSPNIIQANNFFKY